MSNGIVNTLKSKVKNSRRKNNEKNIINHFNDGNCIYVLCPSACCEPRRDNDGITKLYK